MSKALVVDGNNMVMRAFYAMRDSHLSANGVPTATLSAFISMISRYIAQESPTHMVVYWDDGRSSFRTGVRKDYKSNRGGGAMTGTERRIYFGQVKEFLTLSGIHHMSMPSVEADDLIAAHWRVMDGEQVILSSDKDFLQLVSPTVTQIRPGTGAVERWDVERVRKEFGCEPEQVGLVMALTGDSADNVAGVPGFGVKTAVKHLSRHDWKLEALLADESVKRLEGMREHVLENFMLVDLRKSYFGVTVQAAPRFNPTGPASIAYGSLLEFFDQYQLSRAREMLMSGSLWGKPDPFGKPLQIRTEK